MLAVSRAKGLAALLWIPSACVGAGADDTTSADATSDASSETQSTSGDSEACPMPCDEAPGSCFEAQGRCEDEACVHDPLLAGTPCEGPGFCDAMGNCIGGEGDGDGDGDGDCQSDDECVRPHATGTCTAGACTYACADPWENCDGDWINGCEIPVGIPNQCDFAGLAPGSGCGTAWCGQSELPKAHDFGGWYCLACANCTVPGAGQCQWCDHEDTAQWYPAESCGCGQYEDLACSP